MGSGAVLPKKAGERGRWRKLPCFFPRLFAALVIVASTGAAAEAQDIVRLKNGKILSGVIAFEGDSKAGFVLRRWDTGGGVLGRGNQSPGPQAYPVRTRVPSPSQAV